MSARQVKSVITTDMEGRIETFNKGAETIFGYNPGEVIGRKRISLFSPGLVVLGHVNNWLKTAREEGEFKGTTVFVRKDGTPFAAEIRITPTWRNGEQIGYCGVTVERPDIPVEQAMPQVGLATRLFRWLVITRAPFLTATIVPVLVGAAWAVGTNRAEPFPWLIFALTLVGSVLLHVAANTFNDYFDWQSGTDPANNDYFLSLSGGSRSIELRLISEAELRRIAMAVLRLAVLLGVVLVLLRGPLLLVFGAIGVFSLYFYTAPPVRLAARKGLGELVVGLNFGPLMVAGTTYALTGTLSWVDFFVGLPVGLLIIAVLWINQFPDAESDEATGKHNLVVVLGKRRARWGYALAVLGAFAIVVFGVLAGLLPASASLTLVALPIAIYAVWVLFHHYQDRALVRANSATIMLHLAAGALLALGIFLNALLA